MKSGIYKIENLFNTKVYIGSTNNIRKRIAEHKCELRKGTHCNRILQSAWKKYGEESFIFIPIEYCEISELLIKEQEYFDKLNPAYNINKNASTPNKQVKVYQGFIDPNGKEVTITNLTEFSRDNDLNGSNMLLVYQGKRNTHKGWTHKNNTKKPPRYEKWNILDYGTFISPEGEEINVTNLLNFCKEKNLIQSNMYLLFLGQRKSHKGWTYKGNPKKYKVYEGFITPEGIPVSISGLDKFCKRSNLSPSSMRDLKAGRLNSHRGWTYRKEGD